MTILQKVLGSRVTPKISCRFWGPPPANCHGSAKPPGRWHLLLQGWRACCINSQRMNQDQESAETLFTCGTASQEREDKGAAKGLPWGPLKSWHVERRYVWLYCYIAIRLIAVTTAANMQWHPPKDPTFESDAVELSYQD